MEEDFSLVEFFNQSIFNERTLQSFCDTINKQTIIGIVFSDKTSVD